MSLYGNCTNYGISLVFEGPFSLKTPSKKALLYEPNTHGDNRERFNSRDRR